MSELLNQGRNEAIAALAGSLGIKTGGVSGAPCYLDSSPVLISRAWAGRETTARPEPKQTDSWSARHATQRHWGERAKSGPHTYRHTGRPRFGAFVCASLSKCHFTQQDEIFLIKVTFGCEGSDCQLCVFHRIWPFSVWLLCHHAYKQPVQQQKRQWDQRIAC